MFHSMVKIKKLYFDGTQYIDTLVSANATEKILIKKAKRKVYDAFSAGNHNSYRDS